MGFTPPYEKERQRSGGKTKTDNPNGSASIAVLSLPELKSEELPERTRLCSDWMRKGDLGYIFGQRGSGKTWFTNLLLAGLANGRKLQDWEVPQVTKCLYVDGEMPARDSRDRLVALAGDSDNVAVLNYEILFARTGLTMNLADPEWQEEITNLCLAEKFEVLVLDNRSTLCLGLLENDNDDWDKMQSWLLQLRRQGIAVIIIHHAGAVGDRMRGGTRPEDSAFWVIKVERVADANRQPGEQGAKFRTLFTKNRNSQRMEFPKEWHIVTGADGQISIGCKSMSFDEMVLQLIRDGLTSATDIATELRVDKSTVSRSAKRLINDGYVKVVKRGYEAV